MQSWMSFLTRDNLLILHNEHGKATVAPLKCFLPLSIEAQNIKQRV